MPGADLDELLEAARALGREGLRLAENVLALARERWRNRPRG